MRLTDRHPDLEELGGEFRAVVPLAPGFG